MHPLRLGIILFSLANMLSACGVEVVQEDRWFIQVDTRLLTIRWFLRSQRFGGLPIRY